MFSDNLSVAILRLCDEQQLTYESASELCGLSPRYIGSIVRRKAVPTITVIEKICYGLHTTPNDLLLPNKERGQLMFRSPMKVKEVHGYWSANGRVMYPICPRCGMTMDREYQKYCDRCGQCLNWDEYSKESAFIR